MSVTSKARATIHRLEDDSKTMTADSQQESRNGTIPGKGGAAPSLGPNRTSRVKASFELMELAPRQLEALNAGIMVERMELSTGELEKLETCIECTEEELRELEGNDKLNLGCYPKVNW